MEAFVHDNIISIMLVLTLLVMPFYLKKIRQWHHASLKKKRERKKRLRDL